MCVLGLMSTSGLVPLSELTSTSDPAPLSSVIWSSGSSSIVKLEEGADGAMLVVKVLKLDTVITYSMFQG